MAEKRMFSTRIIESDSFFRLSLKAQVLFIHLNMNADDEGIVDNALSVARMTDTGDEALNELIQTGYIIGAAPGLYVITHWKLMNCIPKDRYKPSLYQNVKTNLVNEYGIWKVRSR